MRGSALFVVALLPILLLFVGGNDTEPENRKPEVKELHFRGSVAPIIISLDVKEMSWEEIDKMLCQTKANLEIIEIMITNTK